MTIDKQLLKIKNGRSKTINNSEVIREDNQFLIDDRVYNLTEATEHLKSKGTTKQKKVFDYSAIAFMFFDGHRHLSTHRCFNKNDYNQLVQKAKAKGVVIYYARTEMKNGVMHAMRPFIVDFQTVENLHTKADEDVKQVVTDSLQCPYCDIILNSTSGRTLHIKNRHSEKFEDYKRISSSQKSTTEETDLGCPYCDKVMNSTSGLTNHIKGRHSEKFKEYYYGK